MILQKQIRKPYEKYYRPLNINLNVGGGNNHIYEINNNKIFKHTPKNNAMKILKTFYELHTWYLIDMQSYMDLYGGKFE